MNVDLLTCGLNGKSDHFLFGVPSMGLITDGKTNILFDAGPSRMRGFLQRTLGERGMTTDDIDYVFISHCHWDHVINVDLFRKSTILMARSEYESARHLPENNWAIPPFLYELCRGLKLELLEDEEAELFPGVRNVLLPGHSCGTQGLLIETETLGKVLFAADAVWSARAVIRGRPDLTFFDMPLTEKSVQKAVAISDVIVPGHDRPFRVVNGAIEYFTDASYHFSFAFDPAGGDFELSVSTGPQAVASKYFTL
ncbi:MAG TPA: MBL fold metallo-hydrolase [Clostridia bacterium]|nr:MBL fold metallo-hydrolase [Clostridia bacterium]